VHRRQRGWLQLASHCDNTPYKGKVISILVSGHRVLDTFYIVPQDGTISGGGVWGMAGASIDPKDGDVYTATGNSFGEDEHAGYSERVIRTHFDLSVDSSNAPPIVGSVDEDFGATAVLFTPAGCPPMLAAKNKSGQMFVYKRNFIEHGPTQNIRMEQDDTFFQNQPAWSKADNKLYVTVSGHAATGFVKGVVAFRISNCRLVKAWQRSVGPFDWIMPSPTVANGVVYVTTSDAGHVVALNSATGAHLWTSENAPTARSRPRRSCWTDACTSRAPTATSTPGSAREHSGRPPKGPARASGVGTLPGEGEDAGANPPGLAPR